MKNNNLKENIFFFSVILTAVLLQYSFLNFWGVKPNWVLAVLAAIVVFSGDWLASVNFLFFGALMLKSDYFFEVELISFLVAGIAVIFAAEYLRRSGMLFAAAAAAAGVLVFVPLASYPYWIEMILNAAAASLTSLFIKNVRHALAS